MCALYLLTDGADTSLCSLYLLTDGADTSLCALYLLTDGADTSLCSLYLLTDGADTSLCALYMLTDGANTSTPGTDYTPSIALRIRLIIFSGSNKIIKFQSIYSLRVVFKMLPIITMPKQQQLFHCEDQLCVWN